MSVIFTGEDEYYFPIPNGAIAIKEGESEIDFESFAQENVGYKENNIIVFPDTVIQTLSFIIDPQFLIDNPDIGYGSPYNVGFYPRPIVKIIED